MYTCLLSLENYDAYVDWASWVWIKIGLNELGLSLCWAEGQSFPSKL